MHFCYDYSFQSQLKNGLSKLGLPKEIVEFIINVTGGDYLKIPEAKGSIGAIRNEAFFVPLYELYLTYGGIFRLTFGPKVRFSSIIVPVFVQVYALLSNYCGVLLQTFLIVSDPSIAKHILKDNPKSYSKVLQLQTQDVSASFLVYF